VRRVGAKAVADELGMNARAACLGMLQTQPPRITNMTVLPTSASGKLSPA
jgi:hypothetical protein